MALTPSDRRKIREIRDGLIVEARGRGATLEEVAGKFGVSVSQAQRVCAAVRPPVDPKEIEEVLGSVTSQLEAVLRVVKDVQRRQKTSN